jgi:hypothetical protein
MDWVLDGPLFHPLLMTLVKQNGTKLLYLVVRQVLRSCSSKVSIYYEIQYTPRAGLSKGIKQIG